MQTQITSSTAKISRIAELVKIYKIFYIEVFFWSQYAMAYRAWIEKKKDNLFLFQYSEFHVFLRQSSAKIKITINSSWRLYYLIYIIWQ